MSIIGKNRTWKHVLEDIFVCFALIAGATGIGYFFRMVDFSEINIVLVYILAVLLVARMTDGFLYGVLESILATCTFNYFFTSPYFTLNVDNPGYFITFIIMTVTAIVTSAITSKAKMNALEAEEREQEARVLYQLTNQLAAASSLEETAAVAAAGISNLLKCQAGCMLSDEDTIPYRFLQQAEDDRQVWRKMEDQDEILKELVNREKEYITGAEFTDWPIRGQSAVLGSVRIPLGAMDGIKPEQYKMLHSMIETVGLALERLLSVKRRIKDNEMIEKERSRANLLRSISHDLRTPLTGIMGTSEMLMDMTPGEDPRMELLKDIYKDADWLHNLVENILSLTRLQDGRLVLHKEKEACEEVIGAALQHMKKRVPDREIEVELPDELLMVPMDARLIEQVIVNLVDNAVKHTQKNEKIKIGVSVEGEYAVFEVSDCGHGISEKDMPYVFELFYTTNGEPNDKKQGIGLGLAICEAIIKAHGGRIKAENKTEGTGAVFTFYLPLSEQKPVQEG